MATLAREEVQSSNIVDIPAFDKRTKSPGEIRENWEQMLKEFESEMRDKSKQQLEPPPLEATFDDRSEVTISEPPVIIQTIRFVDADQVIPLNWKLSNKQKQGYLLAWRLCSGSGTALRQSLDRYFTRTSN